MECAVTARLARERQLDPVRVPENAADVLVQHVVGMTLEDRRASRLETAWETVRRAWPYRHLERKDFDRVVEYLQGGGRSLAQAYADTFGKVRVVDGRAVRGDATGRAGLSGQRRHDCQRGIRGRDVTPQTARVAGRGIREGFEGGGRVRAGGAGRAAWWKRPGRW